MIKKLYYKVVGDPNENYIKKLQPILSQINEHESSVEGLSPEDLKAKTAEFKKRLDEGETLDDILPEAFAVVREAAKRTLGQRHYDVQLISGIVLHRASIAEMKTGEGKTLSSTLPVYLNALAGKGVHVVTVNDYLAKRDAEWMGQVYSYLGLSVACIQGQQQSYIYKEIDNEEKDEVRDRGVEVDMEYLKPCTRQEAYGADITYGTNNEFGFDYLRDNMIQNLAQKSQRDLYYCVIDEIDSILIDEARTPLIISAPAAQANSKYTEFANIVKRLKEDEDYNIDEKMRAATLTEEGIKKIEQILGVENIYVEKGISTVHHLEQALKAHAVFKKDIDYVVKDGEIVIVDEFTGRLMPGRRYSEGLHQAIEAKEGVEIKNESITLATITFQNYFRMYEKLSGMTGTAKTEEEEFIKIYGLEVIAVPTNKPISRQDLSDRIYKTEEAKLQAVAKEIRTLHDKGQPVLVGTISIEKNELLSKFLRNEGIPHQMLNAKNHEGEASIIAQAGKKGAVTIATNMAGRGVDIVLGGNPCTKEEQEEILKLGGLYVIGTERHESRRIDNQLRGRSGRQGDAGVSQFYVSLEDDLMRIFGSDRIKGVMERLGVPDDMPIENKMISNALETAQKKVENRNFDTRKHVVQYDDVINKQREVIYKKRKEVITYAEKGDGDKLEEFLFEWIEGEITDVVRFHTAAENIHQWNVKEIYEVTNSIFTLDESIKSKLEEISADQKLELDDRRTNMIAELVEIARGKFEELKKHIYENLGGTDEQMRDIEKQIMLRSIDNLWVEHLETIDRLRGSIGLRGYGQRDPLVEYKKEAFGLFNRLLRSIQQQVVYSIFKIHAGLRQDAPSVYQRSGMTMSAPAKTSSQHSQIEQESNDPNAPSDNEPVEAANTYNGEKVGRNDPCPCGSGKKFKRCHGA